MKRFARAAALALCLAAPACAGPGDPDLSGSASLSVPQEAASIIGTITEADRTGAAPRLLVEQVPTRSAGYPIAWVFVGGSTRILVRSGGQVTRGSAADLVAGARVQAWFTGGVRESFPVQADAGAILVER